MNFPIVPVKRLAECALGKMLQSSASGADVLAPYLRAANVQPDGVMRLEDRKSMWFAPSELAQLTLERGDVVVVEGGIGGYGRAAFVPDDLPGWGFQNSIIRLRPFSDCDGRFLAYALIGARERGLIAAHCNVVSMPHFTVDKVASFDVPCPDSDDQRAIADFLDEQTSRIDTLIDKQTQLITTLRERRVSVTADLLTQGMPGRHELRQTEHVWLGSVPTSWRLVPLWSAFQRIKDTGHPDEPMVSVFRDHGVVLKESFDNYNKTAENRDIYQLVHPGWLLTNRMKAWQGSVGISGVRGITSGHYLCFAPRHAEDNEYLNLLFRSARYTAAYRLMSRGVRPGQIEIDNDEYRLLPVALPPMDEQRELVRHAAEQTSRIDGLIGNTEQHIALAKERRAALITAAVTGLIDVRTAGRAAAEVA